MRRLLMMILLLAVLFSSSCALLRIGPKKKPESEPRVFENDLEEALYWFQTHPMEVRKALSKDRIVYYKAGMDAGNYSRIFGKEDKVHFPFTHYPVWGPDRNTLYLTLYDGKTKKDNIIRLTREGLVEHLFTYDGNIYYFDASPNGKQLVINAKENNKFQMWLVNFEEDEVAMLSDPEAGGVFPVYSPDGRSIAYCASKKIRIRDIGTGAEEIIVDDNMLKELPAWSPDGKWIAYQAARSGLSYDIYKVNVETGEKIQLTSNTGLDANPCFGSDGEEIVFVRSDTKDQGTQKLAIMKADGTNIRVDSESETNVYFPAY